MKKSFKKLCICIMATILLMSGFSNPAHADIYGSSPQVSQSPQTLPDVEGSWAHDYINQLVNLGAITGKADGLFHPNDTITIAEFTKALLVSMGMDPGVKTQGYWADNYISLATYTGIMNFKEYDDTEKSVSRLEMARMIVRALGKEEKAQALASQKTRNRDDASIPDEDKGYAIISNECGIINGYSDGTFNPNGYATRAEATKVIVTFLNVKSTSVKDDSNYTRKEIGTNGITADFFYNEKGVNQKVIVLLGGSEGGKSWSGDLDNKTRQDLLQRGYAILSLAYFGMEGVPPNLQSIPLEYFEKSIDWALQQPGIDKSGVAIMGSSKGGEAALLLASYFPEKVKAVIGIVPSSNVFPGIEGFQPCSKAVSSWSYNGKDIPYAPLIENDNYKKALELWQNEQRIEWTQVYRDAIMDPEAAEKSAIRLEKAQCPILLLSGKQDLCWPSFDMCEKLVNRLSKNNYDFYYEHITYENGDHDVLFIPGAWQKILGFLEGYYPAVK